ncbi:hypothetical protein [Microtetraspora sp. NBRC 13810]|nr:hypothetical protein [Microtetraspora sp. NBRC 13810]
MTAGVIAGAAREQRQFALLSRGRAVPFVVDEAGDGGFLSAI